MMSASYRSPLLPWLLAAAVVLVTKDVNANDIVLNDGTVITTEGIKDASTTKVTFKMGASNQDRAAQDVAMVFPSGDPSLESAIKYLRENGPVERIESNLKRALDRGEPWVKPYAQFFMGELLQRQGKTNEAVAAYEAVAAARADHFYAPVGVYRAAELLLAQNQSGPAQQRLQRLASGEFGPAWKDKGAYMQARLQLKAGQKDQAKASFSKLAASGATPAVKHLAACGEGTCDVLSNQLEPAKRKFGIVISARDAPTEAKGWALKGLGDCLKASSPDEALLAYLKSFLLYPSNPEARAAATAAGEVAAAQRIEGAQRLTALGSAPIRGDDFTGPQPDAELMRRVMQTVSAALVRRLAPTLAKGAAGDEKAELEFLAADAMKAIASQSKDANLMKEYEETLKALQQKYPNHGRAALAGIDGFIATKDRALTLIAQANDEGDTARKEQLMAEGRKLFADNLEPFKATIAELTKQVDAWTEKEAASEMGQLEGADAEQKQDAEFRRDLAEFLLADAYYSYAMTFPEGDKLRAENLKKALDGYTHQIENRGTFQHLLNYAYVGRVDIQIELGGPLLEEAIANARELTDVEPPFLPEDPEARKQVIDNSREMCIRAHIALIKALGKAGKWPEAIEVAEGIEEKKYGKGWQEHPMGVLFSFERAKAMGGAGQGARGAKELWAVVQKAMQAPEAEKIPGLGMSKIGAGACRALSELSDASGGEIYPPAMQYHVGIGYFLRSRPELAIAAFKGVLVAARTPQERREWVPRSVRQIGNLLFEQERYLEAALAYETVMTEFPDHDDAGDAIKYSLSAAKRAVGQFREEATSTSTPIAKFYKSIEQKAAQLDTGQATNIFMREAADLQTSERFLEAAEKYMAVPAETEKDGKKVKVDIYPNAIANAGYCYFQAYKREKGKQELLTKAREQLTRAAQLSKAANDLEARSLACFYLGELECDLERPTEALKALEPFDNELRGTTRYMVRARYLQAEAHLMIDPPPADALDKAEECFRKVADKRNDPKFASFAYFMARTMKSRAIAALKEAGDQLQKARALRVKAARYAKEFFDASEKESLRDAHYFWVGGTLFDGALYSEAVALYTEALKRFQRPPTDGSPEATRKHGDFDTAELNLAFAQVLAGQHREGYEALARIRATVEVKDRDGKLVARGTFKGREQRGPFNMKFQGRVVPTKVWFTEVTIDGKDTKFFDVAQAPAGESEFTGVQGDDPTRSWNPTEQRKLTLPLKREYLVVEGMCRAAWGIYESGKDKKWLATELTAALNELRYVLRGMSDSYYRALMGSTQLEPTDFAIRVWDADVQYLRVKMEREEWRDVVSDIKQMEMLGKLAPGACPAPILEQINAIKRDAEAKQ